MSRFVSFFCFQSVSVSEYFSVLDFFSIVWNIYMVPKSKQGILRDIHFLSMILYTSPPVIIILTSLFFILPLCLLKIQTKSYTLTYTHMPPPYPSSVEWSNSTYYPTLWFLSLNWASRPSSGRFCHCFSQLHSTSINGPHYRDIWVLSSLCLLQSCHNEWPCERAISYFCSHIFGTDS